MIRLDRINLPIFLIGAGIVHLVGLAAVLPMLITLPGPGGEIEPKAVAVDVEIIPATPPSPKAELEVDQTSVLSAVPQTSGAPASVERDQGPAPGESAAQPEPKDASSPALANVSPESAPSTEEPAAAAAPVTEQKTKVESKGGKP